MNVSPPTVKIEVAGSVAGGGAVTSGAKVSVLSPTTKAERPRETRVPEMVAAGPPGVRVTVSATMAEGRAVKV